MTEGTPTTRDQILSGINRVIAAAECDVTRSASSSTIANRGGEIRFCLVEDATGFAVTRAERSGDPVAEAWGMSAAVAQKFLVTRIGDMARDALSRELVIVPFEWGEEADGYSVVRVDGAEQLTHRGDHIAYFPRDSYLHHAVEFSHHAAPPLDALIARFVGQPHSRAG